MGRRMARLRCFDMLARLAGGALLAATSGCFLLPMPRDRDGDSESQGPAGHVLDAPSDELTEPAIEEPIRPLDNVTIEELIDLIDGRLMDDRDAFIPLVERGQ